MPTCLLLCWAFLGPAAQAAGQTETVFLLHGLGRTRASMLIMAWRLRRAGYRTVNLRYTPATESLDQVTARLKDAIVARESANGPYHLIGHSLGNVVIRNGFRSGYPAGLGRVVMLAPPNRPPELARRFSRLRLFRWVAGDSGPRLADPGFYAALPVPTVEFGVLAGSRGHRGLSERPNDGILGVETTRLEGMKDHRVLRHSHTFIMNGKDAAEHCVRFLRTGAFRNPSESVSGRSFASIL